MERTPEQQLKYAKRRFKKETELHTYLLATATTPPSEKQNIIMQQQARKVEHWKNEIEQLQSSK